MDSVNKTYHILTKKSSLWTVADYTEDIYNDLIKAVAPLLHHYPPIVVWGKPGIQRRDIGFFSDESIGYEYSNQLMPSQSLKSIPLLHNLLIKVNNDLGTTFNGILVNKYTDGEDTIGAHPDSEIGLDKNKSMVAAISFGCVRKFRIRDIETKKIIVDIPTTSCSLLVMDGNFQKEYTHEIPTEKKIKDGRISLTFRHHIK